MSSAGAALPAGADPGALLRRLARDRESFLTSGRLPGALRPLVADSWSRSIGLGLDPAHWAPPVELDGPDLEAYRAAHPLAATMPVVRRLLVDGAADAGLVVAVSDAGGRLLWVEGAPGLRRRAEGMGFVEGARWSEDVAGTNAPGTALALDAPVQIFAAEHLADPVTPWSCAAAPVHDPAGRLLGAIDVTGGDDVAAVHTFLLVRAAAAAVEAELRSATAPATPAGVPRLDVLGDPAGATLHGTGPHPGPTRLRLRHAELLVLLATHPAGLSGEQLGILLDDRRTAPVTVRAEVSRLRALLAPAGGPDVARGPYRLTGPLTTDVGEVRALLRTGRVRRALDGYAGPVLPASCAPGVEMLRADVAAEVRACVLASGDPDLVGRYAETPDGRDDVAAWQLLARLSGAGSPRRALAAARLERLDAELGS